MKNYETLKRDKSNIVLNLCNHLQEANKTIEDAAPDLALAQGPFITTSPLEISPVRLHKKILKYVIGSHIHMWYLCAFFM